MNILLCLIQFSESEIDGQSEGKSKTCQEDAEHHDISQPQDERQDQGQRHICGEHEHRPPGVQGGGCLKTQQIGLMVRLAIDQK